MKQTYFTSGEFARLCGTTKETLRHYNNIGILVPAKIAENGYHYYSAFQFYDFYFISTFKGTNIHLKYLIDKLSESDEKAFYGTLVKQLEEIQQKKEELLKKEKLLKHTIDKFNTLYDQDRIGKIELDYCDEEYYIATPVLGKASSDKVWMETIRQHLQYCKAHHFDEEYQLTYCWKQKDLLEENEDTGWSICSQISSPIDDKRFHKKPAGTYACILQRGYDFTTGQYPHIKKQLKDMGLHILGDAYEADVSLFSPSVKTNFLTEISIMVSHNPD